MTDVRPHVSIGWIRLHSPQFGLVICQIALGGCASVPEPAPQPRIFQMPDPADSVQAAIERPTIQRVAHVETTRQESGTIAFAGSELTESELVQAKIVLNTTLAEITAIATAAFETMPRQKSRRGNSVILHKLYFDGLDLTKSDPADSICKAIEDRFATLYKWAADFVASAKIPASWASLG